MLLLAALLALGCKDPAIGQALPPGVIDERGGSLEVDGARLEVPAGAVAGPTTFGIERYDYAVPDSVVPGTAYRFKPEGLTLAQPVRLTIRYRAEDAPAGAWLRVVAVNESALLGGTWRPRLDPALPAVQGETTHLSLYAVADLVAAGMTRTQPATPRSKADVLFMIDNSKSFSLRALRDSMQSRFGQFLAPLNTLSPPIDLHLGIVTSDLGAGAFTPPSCEVALGDAGALQNQALGPTCATAHLNDGGDRFLASGPEGTNFTGGLADAFACYAAVGGAGCGFEHVLGSVRAALEGCSGCADPETCPASRTCAQPLNQGFLRPDASLAVVVITDEDDCSAPADSTLFDPATSAELGPATSYRCFEFGALCGGGDPGREAGPRASCEPGTKQPDQPLHQLVPVEDYAAFLKGLKPDPRLVSLAVLAGPATPVVVGSDAEGNPELAPSCSSDATAVTAAPALRLAKLTTLFDADRASFVSICADDLDAAMAELGRRVQESASLAWCLDFVPADADPMTGLQPDCVVATGAGAVVPPCKAGAADLCYSVGSAPLCAGSGYSMQILRAPGVTVGETVSIQCTTLPPTS
jgi:hypothetical protein